MPNSVHLQITDVFCGLENPLFTSFTLYINVIMHSPEEKIKIKNKTHHTLLSLSKIIV